MARSFVETFPNGAERPAVAEALGMSPEGIRLIEVDAMRWLRIGLILELWAAGIPVKQWMAAIDSSRPSEWDMIGEAR